MNSFSRDGQIEAYARVRSDAFREASDELSSLLDASVILKGINAKALKAWETQWRPFHGGPPSPGEWDWHLLAGGYLRDPDSFHIAVWSDARLCGLGVGKPNRTHNSLSIHFLEGNPDPTHPLKGNTALAIVAGADAYARSLEAVTLRLKDPDPELIPFFERLGFNLAAPERGVQYCSRRIGL